MRSYYKKEHKEQPHTSICQCFIGGNKRKYNQITSFHIKEIQSYIWIMFCLTEQHWLLYISLLSRSLVQAQSEFYFNHLVHLISQGKGSRSGV